MAMHYVFDEPNYDQSTDVYSKLAEFLDTYTTSEDVLLVGDDGLRVLKRLAQYQVGQADGVVRVKDGFATVKLNASHEGITLVMPADVDDVRSYAGYHVVVVPAKKPFAPAKKKKSKKK